MKKQIVTCDRCSKDFKINMKVLANDGDIIVEGFRCPKCHKEYIVTVTDTELRKSIEEVKRLNLSIGEMIDKADVQRIMTLRKKAEILRNYNRNRGEQLKDEYMRKG